MPTEYDPFAPHRIVLVHADAPQPDVVHTEPDNAESELPPPVVTEPEPEDVMPPLMQETVQALAELTQDAPRPSSRRKSTGKQRDLDAALAALNEASK